MVLSGQAANKLCINPVLKCQSQQALHESLKLSLLANLNLVIFLPFLKNLLDALNVLLLDV